MPQVTGLDVLKWVRASEQHQQMRVILLTGEADAQVVALKPDDYIRKGDAMETIRERLVQQLDAVR